MYDGKMAFSPLSKDAAPSLQELRDQIDAIDKHIHDLLIERTEIVRSIASAKGVPFGLKSSPEGPVDLATRPGREATVLRQLVERHTGEFPIAVLVHMWREIIAAKTHLQGGFTVSLHGDGLDPNQRVALWDLARFHFGTITKLSWSESFEQTVTGLTATRPATIAVYPLVTDASECTDCNAWWWRLALQNERAGVPCYVMSRLPFLLGGGISFGLDAFAVSSLAPEPSDDDRSLLVYFGEDVGEGTGDIQVLTRADCPSGVQSDGTVLVQQASLLDVPGFMLAGEPRLKQIAADMKLDPAELHFIGSYAHAIEVAG